MRAIEKKESENDVVCITLQAQQFKWKNVTIAKLKVDGAKLMSIFYADPNHREEFFKLDTLQDEGKTTTYVPIVVMLSAILGPIFCDEGKISWELHGIVKGWLDPKDRDVKRLFRPILEWIIWSCVKGRNEETSTAETYMSVVTLPSQYLKSWQKLRLEGIIDKWPEAQMVAAPQINAGSEVAAVESM